jgi:CHAT domain-containing protein
MAMASSPRIQKLLVGLGILIASLFGLKSLAATLEAPTVRPEQRSRYTIFQHAIQHADWFNWADAGLEFQQAERFFTNQHDPRNALYSRIGVLRGTMEDHSLTEVQKQLAEIAGIPEVQHDPELLLFASIAKADVDGELNARDARDDWQRIEQLATSQNNQKWANRALGEQSFSEFLLGNISKGRILIATALGRAQKTGDISGQIRYLTGIGAVLDQASQYDQALEYLTKAADLVRTHPEAGYAFVTNEYRLEALAGLKNFTDAEVLAKSIIREAAQRNKKVKEAQALITLSRIQQQTSRVNEAIQTLKVAERLTSSGNFTRLSADIQFVLADLYRERGENQTAELRLSRGLLIIQTTPEIWLMPARLESLAELKTADGRYREADAIYHRASDLVDALLGSTTNPQAERGLIAANSEIFVKHFQLCAENLKDVGDAYRGIEEARGRTSLDMLRGAFSLNSAKDIAIDRAVSQLRQQLAQVSSAEKRSELKNAIFNTEQQRWTTEERNTGARPRAAEIIPLPRVQAQLAPDEAMLEYVVGERRVYCLILTAKSAEIVVMGQRAAVEGKIDGYLADIANKQAKTENGRSLYAMLVEPIPGLNGKSHLILVRDGKLNLLPWDALIDNSDRYLVETKNISYAPSMSSAILLREKPPIKDAKALLAVGGVTYDQSGLLFASTRGSYPSEKLGNLPGSRDEVRDAAKLIEARHGQVDLQLGADGTKEAFEQAIQEKYSVIHLAVHALADSKNPDHAALFLLADKKSGTDGVLDSAEVLTLSVRADLVVLSACETAVGRLEGQEGIETLSRAFLLAGARTVVSTLWTIDDTFSRFLIAQFYAELAHGRTVSVALRDAKLELLKTFGPQAVPYRWAAYTLEGADNYAVPLGF